MTTEPGSIRDQVSALAARLTDLRADHDRLSQTPPVRDDNRRGRGREDSTVSREYGAASAFIREARLRRAVSALGDVAAALEFSPPETVEGPDGLTGSPVSQALLVADALAVLDGERNEEGHLPRRAQQRDYAAWAGKRDGMADDLAEHLSGLTSQLDDVADIHASLSPHEPTPTKPERTTGSWT